MTTLFLLTMSDGDVFLEKITEQQLLKEVAERDIGASDFANDISVFTNLMEISGRILIRGEIITPKPVTVVTKWEL